MKARLIILLICFLGLMSQTVIAATADIADTRNFTAPGFATLTTRLDGDLLAPPVIRLGSDDRIVISFDELSTDRRYMRYELIHCDADWQPDRLLSPEYLDGFNEAQVDDYAFSRATTVHYVNYRIAIPNPDMQPKISGNYLLRVYDEEDPESTLIRTRFSVIDPDEMARINAMATSRTDIDYNEHHQQLAVTVDTDRLPVSDHFSEIIVKIEQNGRRDNPVTLKAPLRVAGSKAVYEHQPSLIFPAGNEYRRMETVSTTYPGMHVEGIYYAYPYYHATLATDYPRSEQSYSYDQTQHGRFLVREYNSDDSDTEADYIATHFTLEMPPLYGYDIYIEGDLTLRDFDPQARMTYNRLTDSYEATLLLKQGSYNYQYLAVPYGKTVGLTAPIEGDRYQTVNQYVISVYWHQPGSRYDRLIALLTLNS